MRSVPPADHGRGGREHPLKILLPAPASTYAEPFAIVYLQARRARSSLTVSLL